VFIYFTSPTLAEKLKTMNCILVPTDYSETANKAARFAISMAKKTNAKLVFVNQISILEVTTNTAFTGIYVPVPERQMEAAAEELKRSIKKVFTSMKLKMDDFKTECILLTGVGTVELILEAVKKNKCDLIVMGTHGASGFRKFIIGSNATRVIENASVPVITIPSSFSTRKTIKKIGYATDFENIEKDLKKLIPIANAFDAAIEIFHIGPNFPESAKARNFKPNEDLKKLSEKTGFNKYFYVDIATRFENDFFTGVETYQKKHKPDMLYMVTKPRNWVDKLLDPSKSKEVAYHTTLPLISAKH